MAALHEALRSLGPVQFADVPVEAEALGKYMSTHFAQAQLIAESIPPPAPPPGGKDVKPARSRANTGASVSSAADMTTSNVASEALIAEHTALHNEWGKPLKLSVKDNPLGISVHKLAAKDGRGAWFARRSVHEGLGFDRWKTALLREFPESLAVQGAPGEGNVRGIGGEARLEHVEVEGIGNMTVYRLSAQFPGPTTPRDFVTMILASSDALTAGDKPPKDPYSAVAPRHLITISKPCMHTGAEPRSDFIRGSYESIEMIREVPSNRRKYSVSASNLASKSTNSPGTLAKDAMLRRAQANNSSDPMTLSEPGPTTTSPPESPGLFRKRGTTFSAVESGGSDADGLDSEPDPVEWVMITRSDPGGSVPRFMVERGTPSSICADAKKFLDWACSKDFASEPLYDVDERRSSIALQRNASLAGLPGQSHEYKPPRRRLSEDSDEDGPAPPDRLPSPPRSAGMLSSMAQAAYAGIGGYAASAVGGLTRSQTEPAPLEEAEARPAVTRSSSSSSTSVGSFASAEDYISDETSAKSKSSGLKSTGRGEKELAKLDALKAKLAEKLRKTKEKQIKDQEQMTEREAERARRADEKHAKEVAKAEERHAKEMRNLEARRTKEERDTEERRIKEEQNAEARRRKEERKLIERKEREARREREQEQKSEREELRRALGALTEEKNLLQETCRQLQAENTRLVAAMGKLSGGEDLLKEVRTSEGTTLP